MKPNRLLAAAAYLMATLLIVIPISEAVLSVWPLRAGEAAWRFGASGILSRTLMTALLGVFLAFGTAFYLGQRRTLRVFSALSALGVLGFFAVLGLFGLDALEMRAQVRPEAKLAFDVASAQAVMKYGLAALLAALLAWGGWKASGKPKEEKRKERAVAKEKEAPVLVSAGVADKRPIEGTAREEADAPVQS